MAIAATAIAGRAATYRPMTLCQGIRAAAGRTPGKVAISVGPSQLTYRTLVEHIDRVSNAAAGIGLERGDRVALLAPNCIEYVELVCGLSAIGLCVLTLGPYLAAAELAAIAADAEPKAIFVHPGLTEKVYESGAFAAEQVIELGSDYEDWRARGSATHREYALEEWDGFALCYTSGTTGRPKGVMISHRSRVLTFLAMATEYGCYGPDDRSLCIAPLCHGAGFAFALAPIFFGGAVEILPKFEPELALRLLDAQAATNTFMVPTHFNALFALPDATLARHRPQALRTIISNAAPLPQATKARIVDYFGAGRLHECYGSTEAGIVCNLRPPDQLRKTQCVGLPFPMTEVRLLDSDGRDVADGELGELNSRSPYLFNGYWRQEDATAATMRDGWCTAGDLARRDEEGYYYIEGRTRDMILSGGINIYPREIEELLHQHPAVLEAAVVGCPDTYWGEQVTAFVVMRSGMSAESSELDAFCAARLARIKVPKTFRFIDAIPRNPSGKILKRVLRDSLADTR